MATENSPTISTGRKLLWALIVLGLFLTLSEVVLHISGVQPTFANRFFVFNRNFDYPEVFKRDSELFWRIRPSQVVKSRFFERGEYRINSGGMRGEELKRRSETNIIAALGNSCTFGWQVAEDSCYLNLLVNKLNHANNKYMALNAGIPGYSSFQGSLFYQSDVSHFSPAVTLIMFGWNDQWPAANDIPDHEQEMPSSLTLALQNSVNRLRTYRLLRRAILGASEPELDSLLSAGANRRRVSPEDFSKNIVTICKQVQASGGIPVLLSSPIPDIRTYYGPGHYSPLHERHELYNLEIRRLAFDRNYLLVDLAAEFDQHDDLFTDAKRDPIHFNEKGHALAAEMIYNQLSEIWTTLEQTD
jgi:lysophospholipase L1-like esterase